MRDVRPCLGHPGRRSIVAWLVARRLRGRSRRRMPHCCWRPFAALPRSSGRWRLRCGLTAGSLRTWAWTVWPWWSCGHGSKTHSALCCRTLFWRGALRGSGWPRCARPSVWPGRRPGQCPAPASGIVQDVAAGFPVDAETLLDALAWQVAAHRDRTHVRLLSFAPDEPPQQEISYGGLAAGAAAAGLRARGLGPGERVAITLPTCRSTSWRSWAQ